MSFRNLIAAALALPLLSMPAAAQERAWNFDQTDTDAYLVFGVPESDDIGLSLWCTQRSGNITLFLPETDAKIKPDSTAKLTVELAGKRYRYNGKTTANQEAGSTSAEVILKVTDKLFTAMREADRIKIIVGKSVHTFPLLEVDIETLLQLCAKP